MGDHTDEQVYAFIAEVAALHRTLRNVGEAVAATAGLTHTQLTCLREVADERRTVAAVATLQGVARQGVQRTADGLVAEGLAIWVDNPRHLRAKLLTPTPAGRRALAAAADAHSAWVARAGARLPTNLPDLTVRLRTIRGIVTKYQT